MAPFLPSSVARLPSFDAYIEGLDDKGLRAIRSEIHGEIRDASTLKRKHEAFFGYGSDIVESENMFTESQVAQAIEWCEAEREQAQVEEVKIRKLQHALRKVNYFIPDDIGEEVVQGEAAPVFADVEHEPEASPVFPDVEHEPEAEQAVEHEPEAEQAVEDEPEAEQAVEHEPEAAPVFPAVSDAHAAPDGADLGPGGYETMLVSGADGDYEVIVID